MASATPWLTLLEAADFARCSAVTISREARRGRLKGYKLAGRKAWRFKRDDLDAWLEGKDVPQPYIAPHGGQR